MCLVAKVDDAILALQEQPKKAFLAPLSWDFLPHHAVLQTAKAVLLLFNIDTATRGQHAAAATDSRDTDTTWQSYWALWLVKNIDAHRDGWEWMSVNEPTGLFTKPYQLSTAHLDRVFNLLQDIESSASPDHHCWQTLPAYACLRDWVAACTDYLHMTLHCLAGFPAHSEMQKLVAPPKRTPKANVWFRFETDDGVEYYYNRLDRMLVLSRPEDFDGGQVTAVPLVIQELVQDTLQSDVATRLELERRGKQRVHAQLFAEDEWIECRDPRTFDTFYYSLKHYKVAHEPPTSGVFVSCVDSPAYAAVLKLQAAYRRRRLERRTTRRRTKRNSLPVFSSFANKKSSQFY